MNNSTRMAIGCIVGTLSLLVLGVALPTVSAAFAIFLTGSTGIAILGGGLYLLIEQGEEKKLLKDKDDEQP